MYINKDTLDTVTDHEPDINTQASISPWEVDNFDNQKSRGIFPIESPNGPKMKIINYKINIKSHNILILTK